MSKMLFRTAVIISLFLPYSSQTVNKVNICPSDAQSWTQRSSTFVCDHPREEYHCIQTVEHTLIETCMVVYDIPFYKVGCPWVKIHHGKAYQRNPFSPCDPTHSGCPGNFHRKYRSNEIYTYPACITTGSTTISNRSYLVTEKTTVINFTHDKEDGITTIHMILSCVIVLGCMACVPAIYFICQSLRRKKSDGRDSEAQDNNKDQEKIGNTSDSLGQTSQIPATIEPYSAGKSETGDIFSNRVNSNTIEKTKEEPQDSVLGHIVVSNGTGELVSKKCFTKSDVLTVTRKPDDCTNFQENDEFSSTESLYSKCPVPLEIDHGFNSALMSSSDDEINRFVRITRSHKRTRSISDILTHEKPPIGVYRSLLNKCDDSNKINQRSGRYMGQFIDSPEDTLYKGSDDLHDNYLHAMHPNEPDGRDYAL